MLLMPGPIENASSLGEPRVGWCPLRVRGYGVVLAPSVDVIRALAHLLPDKVHARLAELADAPDSKSGTREGVGVRFPRWAPPSCGKPAGARC